MQIRLLHTKSVFRSPQMENVEVFGNRRTDELRSLLVHALLAHSVLGFALYGCGALLSFVSV